MVVRRVLQGKVGEVLLKKSFHFMVCEFLRPTMLHALVARLDDESQPPVGINREKHEVARRQAADAAVEGLVCSGAVSCQREFSVVAPWRWSPGFSRRACH